MHEEDIYRTQKENYTYLSKMWENSYENLFKPWVESTGEMLENSVLISKEAAPQGYREFYDEWLKTYKKTFGKFYPLPTPETNKETLEKFLSFAEEFNNICSSGLAEFEKNSRKTNEILMGEPDPAKNKECYDLWMKSYEKMLDELMELPARESTKGIFEEYMIRPDIYSNYLQIFNLWKKSYNELYMPLNESIMKISGKMAELSRPDVDPEAYREFYNLWIETYKDIINIYGKSARPSGEILENFSESTNIYLSMYKSWISALEDMSEKSMEMSKKASDPGEYTDFYNLWVKTYQKAFDSFFVDMPEIKGPMKDIMDSVKIMGKMYADTSADMLKIFMPSGSHSAPAYPGKNKKRSSAT